MRVSASSLSDAAISAVPIAWVQAGSPVPSTLPSYSSEIHSSADSILSRSSAVRPAASMSTGGAVSPWEMA